MRVEFATRAIDDLLTIAATAKRFPTALSRSLAAEAPAMIARLGARPSLGRPVANRPGVRVLELPRHDRRIFYRVHDTRITILHIRHTARQDWHDAGEAGQTH